VKEFRLAPMSPLIRGLTIGLLVLPAIFLAAAYAFPGGRWGASPLIAPAVFLVAIYAWVWLGFRPTRFVVKPDAIDVIWPLKRRTIARSGIREVTLVDVAELKRRVGWGARVGAGGLWGGFGWLWTQKRGIVQMYVSRTDRFVWIERGPERAWLVTPEEPEAFIRALGR
jgi:hypothetical protein